jgi:poly-gamma-glutamate synthesis protein (capsule biosynthesis protein)
MEVLTMRRLTLVTLLSIVTLTACSSGATVEEPTDTTTETIATTVTETTTQPYNPIVKIDLSFLGDCTLGTQHGDDTDTTRFNYYALNNDKSYFMQGALPYITTDDFTIANCETVFTDSNLTEVDKGYTPAFWFRSRTENAYIFSQNSVEAVSLANNHTGDFGEQGQLDTQNAIDATNYTQWGNNDKDVILEKDGVKVGLVCCTLWDGNYADGIVSRVQSLEATTDIQVVFFHGGEEGTHTAEAWKVEACHKIVDGGADLIVGGHPHVLQPLETYNGVHIVYSIGNFVFGGNLNPENATIIYQESITYNKDTQQIEKSEENIVPFKVYSGSGSNNYQPVPVNPDNYLYTQILDFMYGNSSSPI